MIFIYTANNVTTIGFCAIIQAQIKMKADSSLHLLPAGEHSGVSTVNEYDSTIPSKRCPKCGLTLPCTTEFWHSNKSRSDGLHGYCRECANAYGSARRLADPEKAKAQDAAWNAANPEKVKSYSKVFRERHPEKGREYSKMFRVLHAEEVRKGHRDYRAAHPDVVRASAARRRARRRSLPVLWTISNEQAALSYWGNKCAYCDHPLPQLKLFSSNGIDFDHYIPLSDPRPDNPGTVPGNMLPVCGACNKHKNAADPIKWIVEQFGEKKAKKIIARIDAYFEEVSR